MKKRYYKSLFNDLTDEGFQYEVNKTFEYNEELKLCKSGFQYYDKIIDTAKNREGTKKIICEVKPLGKILEKEDKFYTNKIRIVKILNEEEVRKITKKEISHLLIKNTKPLDLKLFKFNLLDRTISINTDKVQVCLGNFNGFIVKTGNDCTIKTGGCCDVETSDRCNVYVEQWCNVNVGNECVVKTWYNCTINAKESCNIYTKQGCTIKTGDYNVVSTYGECNIKIGFRSIADIGKKCNIKTYNECTVRTNDMCEVEVGDECCIKTMQYCTVKTGSWCTIDTFKECVIEIEDKCTLNTGCESIIKAKENNVCVRKDVFEVFKIPNNKKIKLNGDRKSGFEEINI